MKISFHTNAFVWARENNADRIISFALDNGFDAIELGPGIDIGSENLKNISKRIPVSALIYCRNFIDDDEDVAERERKELWKRMEAASELNAGKMIISTGISRKLSLPPEGGCNPLLSLDKAVEFLSLALERAKSLGLKLLLENCPMYRNIATSPYMWRRIFQEIPDPSFGLCYDPAHFVWQMIDPYPPTVEFRERIHHVHVKNTCIDREKLQEVGILHNTAKDRGFEENQWWWHSLLDEGEINWKKMLSLLGPDLPDLSFEMEDWRYQNSIGDVEYAMKKQIEYLKGILTAEAVDK